LFFVLLHGISGHTNAWDMHLQLKGKFGTCTCNIIFSQKVIYIFHCVSTAIHLELLTGGTRYPKNNHDIKVFRGDKEFIVESWCKKSVTHRREKQTATFHRNTLSLFTSTPTKSYSPFSLVPGSQVLWFVFYRVWKKQEKLSQWEHAKIIMERDVILLDISRRKNLENHL